MYLWFIGQTGWRKYIIVYIVDEIFYQQTTSYTFTYTFVCYSSSERQSSAVGRQLRCSPSYPALVCSTYQFKGRAWHTGVKLRGWTNQTRDMGHALWPPSPQVHRSRRASWGFRRQPIRRPHGGCFWWSTDSIELRFQGYITAYI